MYKPILGQDIGTLVLDLKQELLIITDEGREKEVITRLARVGFDNTIGYLKGGFGAIKSSEKFAVSDYVCPTTML
jgi:hydroxyacylglutathione hydrolase